MMQLYYAIKAIVNSRGNNLIKIISLSLGLLIGLLLFSRVAYEASFDNFYHDVDNLYLLQNKSIIGGENHGASHIVMAPMAPALNDEFPEVACATSVFANRGKEPFFFEGSKFDLKPLFADSLFFKTMGVRVLSGDDRLLGVADNLFISDKAAQLLFGNENPIGQTLMYMHNYPYTIQGVFENIPNNNTLRGDVVIAFANVRKQFGLGVDWDGGESFWGVVRLVAGANPSAINQKIPDVWRKHFDYDGMAAAGFVSTFYLSPFKTLHSEDSGVHSTAIIMSSLALIMLLVATLNYVLISISSLVKRAKGVGIHKCNGASSGSIFGMFMYETAILVLLSLLLVVGALFVFRASIDTLMNVPLAEIFSLSNLWVSGLVVLFLFLMGGILPARIFSAIPVTQIFRAFTNNKRRWKQLLLFFQFVGITFVTLMLIIAVKQYNLLINKDLGYNSENIVYFKMNGVKGQNGEETTQNIQLLQQELARFPFIETSATSMSIPMGYSGAIIRDDEGNTLFSGRYEAADYNYISTMQMEFVNGGNFTAPGQVIVTEEFVKKMGWKDNPIGKEVNVNLETGYGGKIVGVLKDYASAPLYAGDGYPPVLIEGLSICRNILNLRLTGITPENMQALDNKLVELYPTDEMGLTLLKERIDSEYTEVRTVKNIILVACIFILLITLMGLIGYVGDEIQRRRKEIAIRKINGATISNILRLITRNLAFIALPAIVLAATGAYFVGELVLQMFTVKAALNAPVFIGGSLAILLVLTAVAIIKSWRIANENPSKTVSSE
ncbi:ABC transporter permease [Bacteroidia bacterium]|nr:ABC transporter permease [Bacteroidia bacterium]